MKTFSKHYCVTIDEDGSPREISRFGSVVTYKAVDYRTGRAVALQVIPVTHLEPAVREEFERQARAVEQLDHPNIARVYDLGLEDDHIVFVSEYLQGETAEAWLMSNGPMPADAVARIGMQIVSALQEASFRGLTHRALQPSNLFIADGATAEGDWPFVKLLNLGLAGLKLHEEESAPRELIPSISPSFASPEQLVNGKVDFRSEIFSLGATLCFLLTGAVPLARAANRAGIAERSLPPGIKIPRALRKILPEMLRHDPDQRPGDPVALSETLRRGLRKVSRKPPASPPRVEALAPVDTPQPRRLWPVAIGATVVLLACAVAAAFVFPEKLQSLFHGRRDLSSIGVPIGVPEKSSPAPAEKPAPLPSLPSATPSPRLVIAESTATPPPPSPENSPARLSDVPVVANNRMAEPPPPEEGPRETAPIASPAPAVAQNSPAESESSISPTVLNPKINSPATPRLSRASKAKALRANRAAEQAPPRAIPEVRVGDKPAQFVGIAKDGRWILRVNPEFAGNSGKSEIVLAPPPPNPNETPASRRQRASSREKNGAPLSEQPPVTVLPPEQ